MNVGRKGVRWQTYIGSKLSVVNLLAMISLSYAIVAFCVAQRFSSTLLDIPASAPEVFGRFTGRAEPADISTPFDTSLLNPFLALYDHVTQPQSRNLILLCATPGTCGGIADRARAIPFAVSLALLGNRQLVLDPSIMTNVPSPQTVQAVGEYDRSVKPEDPGERAPSKHHFWFNTLGVCISSPLQNELVAEYIMDTAPTVFVTTNCSYPHPWQESRLQSTDEHITLRIREVERACHVPHLCGAAILRRTPMFAPEMARAQAVIENMPTLQYRNYTALHVRAGGSHIRMDVALVKAVPWDDGYASQVPQLWIDAFSESTYAHCLTPVLVVSDSDRVISELRFAAKNRLPIVHCCSQPLHRDLPETTGFFFQEVLDLFSLTRARTLIGGIGGFLTLAQHWGGEDGPETRRATTRDEVRTEMRLLLNASGCENIHVPP